MDTNKLKELAERATPGPWVVDAQQSGAIIALLDEIDRLKAENEVLRGALKQFAEMLKSINVPIDLDEILKGAKP